MGLFSYIFASDNARNLKKLEKIAKLIESKEEQYKAMSEEDLKGCTQVFKQRLADGETLNDILPDAYACVREVADRVLHQRPYHVQLLGAIALFQGRIAEMRTGEGKTLTESLPAYLVALEGKGVHIVTVNDYLAKRDSEWIGKIFRYLGLTVGYNPAGIDPNTKRKAYLADITYGTNNEFGFDYLRDNMARRKEDKVQRGQHFAIVDEVDSILIDEARTPLIISGMGKKGSDGYIKADSFCRTLRKTDYEIDEKEKSVRLQESGIAKAERYFGVDNLSDIENIELNHYINNALRAHFIMKRDNNYIVKNDEIVIVDEFTGRLMDGRKYSNGLHQAIEAKEKVRIKEESQTMATITFQNYFRLYHKLSGMTGTAKTEEMEFNKIYNLDVVTIPTNKPVARKDYNDVIYATEDAKYRNIVEEVKKVHETGRPILVGTITIEKSERISKELKMAGVKHTVLNAKNHELESQIIAQAGRLNQVTIATNMAGRGTDILLGGNPEFLAKHKMKELGYAEDVIEYCTSFDTTNETEELKEARAKYQEVYQEFKQGTDKEKEEVKQLGGLHIIGTERHDSRRIDNQLRGRAGRQGDPGSSVFYISCEDELARVFGGDKLKAMMTMFRIDEDTPYQSRMISGLIEKAQKRIEGFNFSMRHTVLQYDNVLNEQRKIIYAERNRVLDGANIHGEVIDMIDEYAKQIVFDHLDENGSLDTWDLAELNNALRGTVLPKEADDFLVEEKLEDLEVDEIADLVAQEAILLYENKISQYKEEFGIDLSQHERACLLQHVDVAWMQHIDFMDMLRKEIGLQAHGNHDPVQAYKKEGFEAFDKMISKVREGVARFCCQIQIRVEYKPMPKKEKEPVIIDQKPTTVKKATKEVGRNDVCPCGSGKKYKNCCGREE